MKYICYLIISLSIFFNYNKSYTQNTEKHEETDKDNEKLIEKDIIDVIELILWETINPTSYQEDYYIECDKPKTFFNDKNNFIEETGFIEIPIKILDELEEESNKYKDDEEWDKNFFKKLNPYILPYLGNEKCLSEKAVNKMQKEWVKLVKDNRIKRKASTLLTLHKPIFDKSRIHCVITFAGSFYINSFYSQTYFLKKIYGKWIIIGQYDKGMS